jgi:hypothetical protein
VRPTRSGRHRRRIANAPSAPPRAPCCARRGPYPRNPGGRVSGRRQ